MAKMVNCKACGKEIAKSAKVCPYCGAKRKKHVVLGIVLLFIGLILIVAAFSGGDEQPKKVENGTEKDGINSNQPESNENEQSGSKEPTVFGIGESAELNDVIVTLVNVTENNGANYVTPADGNVFVVCEFEIQNNSKNDLAVSSLMSFEAYIDDYSTNISLSALTSSDKSQLDGAIAPGKKMNGIVGYEAASDWKTIEIRFKSNVWSNKEYLFEYSK